MTKPTAKAIRNTFEAPTMWGVREPDVREPDPLPLVVFLLTAVQLERKAA